MCEYAAAYISLCLTKTDYLEDIFYTDVIFKQMPNANIYIESKLT